jgi:hypothetical protein
MAKQRKKHFRLNSRIPVPTSTSELGKAPEIPKQKQHGRSSSSVENPNLNSGIWVMEKEKPAYIKSINLTSVLFQDHRNHSK